MVRSASTRASRGLLNKTSRSFHPFRGRPCPSPPGGRPLSVSDKSSRVLMRELERERRRRERLVRRAPRLHRLIDHVEAAWHRAAASTLETLGLWLVELHAMSAAGSEITQPPYDGPPPQPPAPNHPP